jgi:hypothetical protein
MSQHEILCGACKRPAKGVPNPEPHDKVVCSGCGREDRFDNVMRSVKEYVADSAAKHLSASLAQAVRGSKFIKLSHKRGPQRSFRWITTDLGL